VVEGAAIRPFRIEVRRRRSTSFGGACRRRAGPRGTPRELYQAPRSWAERAYPDLIYFNEVDKGNHFAAWQEPERFTTEVRAASRSLR
jgi:hypothetical protein